MSKKEILAIKGFDNHQTICHRLVQKNGYNPKKLSKTLRGILMVMNEAIKRGEKVRIKGFGTFSPTRLGKQVAKRKRITKQIRMRRSQSRKLRKVVKNINNLKKEYNLYY